MPNTKPSVLIINRVYPPVQGASGRLARDLVRHLIEQGHKTTMLTSAVKPGRQKRGPMTIQRVRGQEKPNASGYFMALMRLGAASFTLKKSDIVITMTDPPFLSVLGHMLAKLRRARHIHWCLNTYPDLFPVVGYKFPDFLMGLMQRFSRAAMLCADTVVVPDPYMARHLESMGVEGKNIVVIESWADRELTYMGELPAPSIRQLPPSKQVRPVREDPVAHKFRMLYAGNIGRTHPMDTVLKAAHEIATHSNDVEFAFAGKGPGYDRLAARRAAAGLDNIRILPFQPRARLRYTMEGGDVHLVTMDKRAAGLMLPCKFYLALAVARPVIFVGPEKTLIADIIRKFGCGVVVGQDDVDGLVRAISLYRDNADAWFAASDGAKKAFEGRGAEYALARWSLLIAR